MTIKELEQMVFLFQQKDTMKQNAYERRGIIKRDLEVCEKECAKAEKESTELWFKIAHRVSGNMFHWIWTITNRLKLIIQDDCGEKVSIPYHVAVDLYEFLQSTLPENPRELVDDEHD